MTFSLTIGGTDVAGKMVLPEGLGELTSAADGQSNECLITVDDPDGSMTFLELDDVIAEESACAYPRSFTGIVTQSNHRRGTYKDGPGRVWDITITDLNERMHRRVLHASDANRLSETGTERLDWLMSSVALDGLLVDNGQIMANAWEYDTADYRGEYADDVLSSIVSASAVARWTFFAYWDPIAEEASLFYGDITTTTYDSTLSLTNYLPDKNDTTIFAPYVDVALTSEAEGIYDGVYVDCVAGKFYRQRPSTFATYGKHRDGVMDSVRINNATTAARHMETYLDYHSGPTKVITATVQLPREQVNLIDAGMRVQVYFTHIEGYDDPGYTWVRVTRRTVTFTNGRNDLYDVKLELSTRGISQTGGGNPGDFPLPPSQPGTLVQQKGNPNGVTLDAVPIDGNLLMAWVTIRTFATYPGSMAGWTHIVDVENDVGPYHAASLFTKIASSETGVYTNSAGTIVHVSEWNGVTLGAHVSTNDQGPSTAVTAGGPITPAAANAIVVGNGLYGGFATAGGVTPAAGVTELFEQDTPGGLSPTSWVGMKIVSTPTSTTIGATMGNTTMWAGVTYELLPVTASSPPSPGQWVGINPPEYVTMTGTSGTTAFPFADNSLSVFYDLQDQSAAIISYDGAAGTFVMAAAPIAGMQVTVTYQGR